MKFSAGNLFFVGLFLVASDMLRQIFGAVLPEGLSWLAFASVADFDRSLVRHFDLVWLMGYFWLIEIVWSLGAKAIDKFGGPGEPKVTSELRGPSTSLR